MSLAWAFRDVSHLQDMEAVLKEYDRIASKTSSQKTRLCLDVIENLIAEAKQKILAGEYMW